MFCSTRAPQSLPSPRGLGAGWQVGGATPPGVVPPVEWRTAWPPESSPGLQHRPDGQGLPGTEWGGALSVTAGAPWLTWPRPRAGRGRGPAASQPALEATWALQPTPIRNSHHMNLICPWGQEGESGCYRCHCFGRGLGHLLQESLVTWIGGQPRPAPAVDSWVVRGTWCLEEMGPCPWKSHRVLTASRAGVPR